MLISTLKPLLCASPMLPLVTDGDSPALHLCWNLTQVIPAVCISVMCEMLPFTCPPSSKLPPTIDPLIGWTDGCAAGAVACPVGLGWGVVFGLRVAVGVGVGV